jgi:universal stress protein A
VPQYKKILVAVDLSPHSETTLRHAINIAQNHQASLHVVHVLEHASAVYGGDFSIPLETDLQTTIKNSAQAAMAALAEKYDLARNKLHIETGPVKTAITTLAETLYTDLIIVGSHSHTGLDLLLGSRANAVLHLAHCDVWVIKNK